MPSAGGGLINAPDAASHAHGCLIPRRDLWDEGREGQPEREAAGRTRNYPAVVCVKIRLGFNGIAYTESACAAMHSTHHRRHTRPLPTMTVHSMLRRSALVLGCTSTLLSLPALAEETRPFDPLSAKPQLGTLIDQMYPDLKGIYEDLHAHPELGFQETRTAAKLAAEMRKLGFEVTEGVGKTGLVAILKNGAGPTTLVRTELDALPMEEKTGLPYASKAKAQYNGKETFVAHSCGHDIHMTSWIGTARSLAAMKDRWKGTLMFIAQPSEETVTGAQAMIDDGLFTRFGKPAHAFALHSMAMPYGTVGYRSGPTTSNGDGLDIHFHGRGGHGSAPDKTIDPILMASKFVVDVQSVVSREKNPMEFGVISVGTFNAGTAGNIIPDEARVMGTIRSYSQDVRQRLHEGIERTAKAQAAMAGAPEPKIQLKKGSDA